VIYRVKSPPDEREAVADQHRIIHDVIGGAGDRERRYVR
jgi:hypothetical protein